MIQDPPWETVEQALDAILDRRWYTNHGPLAQRLETFAATHFKVRHAIVVTNPTIGLIMLAEALSLSGTVILPAPVPPRCMHALQWAGLDAHPCRPDQVAAAIIDHQAAAILATPDEHETTYAALAVRHRLAFFTNSQGANLGPAVITLPNCGDDAGAACITTNDDALASRLRNIRSSYGAGPAVPVNRTANGRLSEIQAAMALLALGQPA